MLPKLLEGKQVMGTRLSEVLISQKLLKNIYGQRKNKLETKKTSRKHGKLLQNAVNWYLYYIICTCNENKRIKIPGASFL